LDRSLAFFFFGIFGGLGVDHLPVLGFQQLMVSPPFSLVSFVFYTMNDNKKLPYSPNRNRHRLREEKDTSLSF